MVLPIGVNINKEEFMSHYTNLQVDIASSIALVTISRESKLNALNKTTLEEISLLFKVLAEDSLVKGIILTGAGQKAFIAGADIAEFTDLDANSGRDLSAWGHAEVMDLLYNFPKPIVAAINGFALGGGLEVALACHFRIASSQARLGLPEVSLGLIPGYGGTQRLPALVGRGRALELILSGNMIDAEKALSWGLVNQVVPQEELLAQAEAFLQQIFQRSPLAVAAAIKAVNAGLDPQQDGYAIEIDSFGKAFETPDFQEGVHAFLEKRKPNF